MAGTVWNRYSLHGDMEGQKDISRLSGHAVFADFLLGFKEDWLMVSDPKALKYIMHKAPYRFQRPPERRGLIEILAGKGLTNVEGLSSFNYQNAMLVHI
jgi:hypothetical protein